MPRNVPEKLYELTAGLYCTSTLKRAHRSCNWRVLPNFPRFYVGSMCEECRYHTFATPPVKLPLYIQNPVKDARNKHLVYTCVSNTARRLLGSRTQTFPSLARRRFASKAKRRRNPRGHSEHLTTNARETNRSFSDRKSVV